MGIDRVQATQIVARGYDRIAEAGYEEDWLGAPMYWSHHDAAASRALVAAAGLRLLAANEEFADEDGVPVPHLWLVAAKPGAAPPA